MPVQHVVGRWIVAYALGAGTVAFLRSAGKPVVRQARPLVRSAVKGSLIAGRQLRRVAEETGATMGDIVAEARDEIAPPPEREPMTEDVPVEASQPS